MMAKEVMQQNKQYDLRFNKFLKDIIGIARMKPKSKYLYTLMDGVPFRDLEVSIILCQIDFEKATNDNKK